MASNVFISYSRKDSEFVARLESALSARDKQVWLDIDDIAPGAKWRDEIHVGLAGCDGVVFVMTPESLGSDECGKEIIQAIGLNKRIVPVLRAEPNGSRVPEELAEINWVKLRPQDDFDQGVDDLIEALDKDFAWVHEHTRLGLRAAEWSTRGRERGYLLRGADLTQAERFLTDSAGKQPEPTAEQLEYVAASRVAAKRFNQRLLASVSFALLLAMVLSVVAFIERNSARASQKRAYSRQLAADAETQLAVDPELSVLLASKAYDVNPTAESVDVLRQALVTSKIRMAVRPADGVSQAALTPDGHSLVTVGRSDGIVRLWRYPGARALGALPGVVAAPGQMAVNPNDGRVMVVDRAGSVHVFAGLKPAYPAFGSSITTAAWAVDGRDIVTGAADGTVASWNGRTGVLLGRDRHTTQRIGSVTASAQGGYIGAMTESGQLLVYDIRHGRVFTRTTPCVAGPGAPRIENGQLDEPRVIFSRDESRFVTIAWGTCSPGLWRTVGAKRIYEFQGSPSPIDAAFSPDSQTLVLAGVTPVSLRASDGTEIGQFTGHDGTVDAVSTSSGSRNLNDPLISDTATAGEDGTIRLWSSDLPTASTVTTLRADAASIGALTLTADDRLIVSVDGDEGTARVWSTTDFPDAVLGNPIVSAVGALSFDGRLALGDASDGRIAIFDARSGRERVALPGSSNLDHSLNVSASAGFLAGGRAAYLLAAGGLRLWRTADGSPIAVSGLDPGKVASVTASPEGSRLWVAGPWGIAVVEGQSGAARIESTQRPSAVAVNGDGSVLAFATGDIVHVLHMLGPHARSSSFPVTLGRPTWLAVSGNGSRIAAGAGGFLQVYDARGGRPVGAPLTSPREQLSSLALSGDGSLVAGGYTDLVERVWSARNGRLIVAVKEAHQPNLPQSPIAALAISRDDNFFITSVGSSSATNVWDLASGVRLLSAPGQLAGWSDASHRLATLGGPLETWTCEVCGPPATLRRLAGARATRSFTPGEAAKFLQQ